MALARIHTGKFVSVEGVTWQVDILRVYDPYEDEEPGTPGELTFPADEPLVIEWPERGKEEAVCGSSCTLRIVSPGDRTYVGLYTEKAAEIFIEVYRNGSLWWTGSLDTEQYEEPYESLDDYEVTLTFSDFGVLDRQKFGMEGTVTLYAIFRYALARAGLDGLDNDFSLISSKVSENGATLSLSDLTVSCSNFYDEDGEPMTVMEALIGILQPLALRVVQRAGTVHVYDLNGLATLAQSREVWWSSDHQTLGVDKVYNDIKVTFSPYGDGALMTDEDIKFGEEVDEEETNYNHSTSTATKFSYFPDLSTDWSWNGMSGLRWPVFTIHLGDGEGLAQVFGNEPSLYRAAAERGFAQTLAAYFRIVSQGGGSDAEGLMWMFRTGLETNNVHEPITTTSDGSITMGHAWPTNQYSPSDWASSRQSMFTTRRVYLPPMPATSLPSGWGGSGQTPTNTTNSNRFKLRLAISMLADWRYNPFGEKNYDNGGIMDLAVWIKKDWEDHGNYLIHHCHVKLWDAKTGGNCLYHYDNESVAFGTTDRDPASLGMTIGSWVSGNSSTPTALLTWYDAGTDDRNDSTGICGWQENHHSVGRGDDTKLSEELKNAPAGQYIPYPPQGGWLDIEVMSHPAIFDGENNVSALTSGLGYRLRWLLYKHPTLEVVSGFKYEKVEVDDIEFKAHANSDAQEPLELDTVCGTLTSPNPCARGALRWASGGAFAWSMYRAGKTDRIERLWLGTLYSQFASRHAKLDGEARIDGGGLCPYTEQNQGSLLFACTGETVNAIADTSEMTLVELSPDEYEAEIYD